MPHLGDVAEVRHEATLATEVVVSPWRTRADDAGEPTRVGSPSAASSRIEGARFESALRIAP